MNRILINLLKQYWIYLILFLLIYIPVFRFLHVLPIRLWDESRLAINALDMSQNHNYIVTYYNGEPDLWNTKPPLMIWTQVFFIKLFGLNEISLRLPSAFSAFFTVILILIFSEKHLKSRLLGFLWSLVLITSHGYINIHSTRTGDYDAMLTFFSFAYILFFYLYGIERKTKYLYFGFISLTLAVLTKGIAGLFFTPVILFFLIIILKKDFIKLLKDKHLYFGLSIFLLFGIGYYFLRELLNPGYIDAVMKNELGGRYLEVNENHQQEFWYYYNNFINFQIKYWYLYVIPGILLSISSKQRKINIFSIYTFLNSLFFFLIISTAKTKLEWYDIPLYPLISFFIAYFFYFIIDYIKTSNYIKQIFKYTNVIIFIVLFFFFVIPYKHIIYKTYKPIEYSWDKHLYEIGYLFKDAIKGKVDLNNTKYFESSYHAQNLFYIKVLQSKDVNIKDVSLKNIKINDKIIIPRKKDIEKIKSKFEIEKIFSARNVNIYLIKKQK